MFVNLPVNDSSPPFLIPGHNFLEEIFFSLRPNHRKGHWENGDGEHSRH